MAPESAQGPIASAQVPAGNPAEPIDAKLAHPIAAVLHETLDSMSKTRAAGVRITGIATGFDVYDHATRGLHNGELTLFVGRHGITATSLALGAAFHVASPEEFETYEDPPQRWREPGRGVLIFSLGTSRRQIVSRMLCSEARVELVRVRTGILSGRDWDQLTPAAARLATLDIWINDTSDLSCDGIRSIATRVLTACDRLDPATGERRRPIGLIVIDCVHRVRGGRRALRKLKALARDLMVPIVATTTVHPCSDDRNGGGHRPLLSDLRLHDDDADHVCLVHHDDDYPDRDARPEVAELTVCSQRDRSTETVRLRWEPRLGRFENLPEVERDGDGT